MELSQLRPTAPPLLPGKPIVGNFFDLTRDQLGFLQHLASQGPVSRFRMFNLMVYQISEPAEIQHVLQDNARNYIKGKLFDFMRNLVGNGLFVSDGEFWLRQRRMMQPAFHQRRLVSLVEGMVAETQTSIERWSQAAASGQVVDMAGETTALAMRVVTRALFSSRLSGKEKRLAEAITLILDEISFRFRVPLYPPLRFPTPRNRKALAALRTIDEVVFEIINARRSAPGDQNKDDLLAMLMEARDEGDGKGMTDRQLRDETLIMFAAGHETTANAMAWAFYLLDRHPEVFTKLRAEVMSVLNGRPPTAEDLPRLVYTRMVIEEVLRLYPPLLTTNRQALKDDVVGGYTIPAGALISISPYLLQRDPRYWKDPEKFDPERFSPEAASERPRFAYFPFGGGPRLCIGKEFALFESTVVLAMAVQCFDWQLAPGADVHPLQMVTFRPNSVPVVFKPIGY
jgi:cytochrome P450